MSITENMQGLDQSVEAIVDQYDAGAELGRAYAGDTAARFAAESRWASAQIEQFGEIDADGTWIPSFELTVEDWAEGMARSQFDTVTPADVLDITFTVQKALAAANTKNSASMIERVSLDIYPDVPGRPQDLQHPTAPMVVFLSVKRGSFLWDDGNCRAVAVWFQPNVGPGGEPLDAHGEPLDEWKGRLYADTRHLDGYLGVVERFGSLREAQEAADELRRAVRVAGTPAPSQYTDDPLDEIAANIDQMDAADRRRAQQGRRERQFAARRQSPI